MAAVPDADAAGRTPPPVASPASARRLSFSRASATAAALQPRDSPPRRRQGVRRGRGNSCDDPGAGAAAAAAAGPPAPGRQASRRSKGSVSQAIGDLAGRASFVFRRASSRFSQRSDPPLAASPVRSATFDLDEPAFPPATMTASAPPLFREPDEYQQQYMTGASAEYYSGDIPMSPPEADYPAAAAASAVPGRVASKLVSLGTLPALVGVPPAHLRRTASDNTDFSPLSPVSPTIKREHSPLFERADEEAADDDDDEDEYAPDEDEDDEDDKPVKREAPSPRATPQLVPSPRLPAPGTVNPMDVWTPTNKSELSHHTIAQLDRIRHSAPPSPMHPLSSPSPEPSETLQEWKPAPWRPAPDVGAAALVLPPTCRRPTPPSPRTCSSYTPTAFPTPRTAPVRRPSGAEAPSPPPPAPCPSPSSSRRPRKSLRRSPSTLPPRPSAPRCRRCCLRCRRVRTTPPRPPRPPATW